MAKSLEFCESLEFHDEGIHPHHGSGHCLQEGGVPFDVAPENCVMRTASR